LNAKEYDARSTMKEIIGGYPFVENHKTLLEDEERELKYLTRK
jgi:hypothetical protein